MKKITLFVMLVVLCSTAFAGNLGLKSIAPTLGVAMPEDLDATFYLGVGVNMGEITENLELVPFLGFWSSSQKYYGVKVTNSDFIIGSDVHYKISQVEGLYAGGGLSLNFISYKLDNDIAYYDDSGVTRLGIGLLGGYEFSIGGRTAFAELKYNIISHFNTLELKFGMNFDL